MDTSVALIIAKTLSPTLRFIRLTEPVVIIAVTSPEAVRSISSETTLSETIALIVPGIRFRMLVSMLILRDSTTTRRDIGRTIGRPGKSQHQIGAAFISARTDLVLMHLIRHPVGCGARSNNRFRLFRIDSSSSIMNTIGFGVIIAALIPASADENEKELRLHLRFRRQYFRHAPRRSSARWQDPFRGLFPWW